MVCGFRRLRLLPNAEPVEQLPDEAECVGLIIVPADRKAQKLRPQVGKPRCALAHIETEHRHAAAHRLGAYRLVAAAHKLLAGCVGLLLDGAPLQERSHP